MGGVANISLLDIVKATRFANQWVSLDKCKSGEVLISAEYLPMDVIQASTDSEKHISVGLTEASSEKVDEEKTSAELDHKKEASVTNPAPKEEGKDIPKVIPVQTVHRDSESTTASDITKEKDTPIPKSKHVDTLEDNIKKETIVAADTIKEEIKISDTAAKEEETISVPVVPAKSLPRGEIHVTVHKAKNLQKKGMFGKADPYVVVKLADQTFKSKTVKNNQNPEWNYPVALSISEDSPTCASIEVFDEDIGKDDAMGVANISLLDIVMQPDLSTNGSLLTNVNLGKS